MKKEKVKTVFENSFEGALRKTLLIAIHECEKPKVISYVKKDRALIEISCRSVNLAMGIDETGTKTLIKTEGIGGIDREELEKSLRMQKEEFIKVAERLYEPKRDEEDNPLTLSFLYYLAEVKPEEAVAVFFGKRGMIVEGELAPTIYDLGKILTLASYPGFLVFPIVSLVAWITGTALKAVSLKGKGSSRFGKTEKRYFPDFEKEKRAMESIAARIRTYKENAGI